MAKSNDNQSHKSNIEEFEKLLEFTYHNKWKERPVLARSYLHTNDVDKTIGYLLKRWDGQLVIDNLKLIPRCHTEPISQIYGSAAELPRSLTSLVEKYLKTLLIIKGDFENISREGCQSLLSTLVENQPPQELQKAWKDNETYLLFVSTERAYTFLLSSLSGQDIRLPGQVFRVNWRILSTNTVFRTPM